MRAGDGNWETKSSEIKDIFKQFYINLDNLNGPKVSVAQQEGLDSPISSQEIIEAIKALPAGNPRFYGRIL